MKRTLTLLIFITTLLAGCALPAAQAAPTPSQSLTPTIAIASQTVQPPAEQQVSTSFDINKNWTLAPLTGSYLFAEGPAVDSDGNVYFSDINAGKIYKWSQDGNINIFLEGLNKPNGLMFDQSGNLIVCEGGNGRLLSVNAQGQISVIVDQYNGTRFNEPNDLWINSQGGIYFTDPAYQSSVVQGGEYVYYISPDRNSVIRVVEDMVRPNGIVGTADGKSLYITDHGTGQTFIYSINADGTLTNKQLFAAVGSDGMELDEAGNLYLTTPNKVQVYDDAGNLLKEIPTQENPTNVAFGGADRSTLFITARTAVYVSQLSTTNSQAESAFTLTSPDLPADGRLPAEYTCDGASSTLAITWSGAPAETQSFAVIMHHNAPDNAIHWYWVLYDIPSDVTYLTKNSTGIGTLGTNSVNDRLEYAPPCSKGPGDKEYIYTVYALSAQPQFTIPASQINRDALLDAIKDITLASAELHVVYARPQ